MHVRYLNAWHGETDFKKIGYYLVKHPFLLFKIPFAVPMPRWSQQMCSFIPNTLLGMCTGSIYGADRTMMGIMGRCLQMQRGGFPNCAHLE